MKTGKKITALILSAMLAVSSSAAMAVTVSAEEDTAVTYSSEEKTWGDYDYQVLDDGTVEIMNYKGFDTNLVIPSEIDGKKVTQITNMFDGSDDTAQLLLESVVIPEGITTISIVAFRGCSSLENITIPDSLTTIAYGTFDNTAWYDTQPDGLVYLGKIAYGYKGNMPQNTEVILKDDTISISSLAFVRCDGLTSITIPDSVKEIGYSAFDDCTSLKNITVSNNNNSYCSVDGVLFNKDKTKLICYPDKKAGAKYSIPNSVVTIGKRAFEGNKSIESIEIPNSVQEICDRAFLNCTNLKDINIPDSVVFIEDGDGSGVFSNCTSLTNMTIPDGITTVPCVIFKGCTGLTSVTIPNSINKIDFSAFSGCTGLKNIKIPDSVTEIEAYAFEDCAGLESINIPDGVTILDNNVFDGCTTLKDIKIPDNVTLIGNWTFANCKSLTSIVIPNSVEKIASGAFSNCDNLKNVTILNSNAEIVDRAFGDSQDLTIYGYVGSTAETYANKNGLKFVDINKKTTTLTSKIDNISVKGTFDDSVTLNVEKATVKNAVAAYDITLKDENGNTIQPSGEITVSIPSDKANCKVYWIKEDGTKADMNATYNNGNYEFTTDHLSVYALIADTSNGTTSSETGKNAVNTGDNNVTAVTAIFAAGALAAVILMHKKKKA